MCEGLLVLDPALSAFFVPKKAHGPEEFGGCGTTQMVIHGALAVIHGALVVIHGVLAVISGGLVVIK